MEKNNGKVSDVSRRDFIKSSAAMSLIAAVPSFNRAFAAGSDKIRIGVIGCGARGVYDLRKCLLSDDNVELVAMGDLFKDQLDACLKDLEKKMDDGNDVSEKVNVAPDKQFVGFDAYKKVIACDVDLVMLCTPPCFRPVHLRAAIEAGKHVFAQKPVAVDPVGVRHVIETSELADKKGLTIMAGTQFRRIRNVVQLMERLNNGDAGEIVGGQCTRVRDGMGIWSKRRAAKPDWSQMETQIRRWLFYTWLSGDFITEMHVHNLDLINWAMGSHPVKCTALGGRQVRRSAEFGNVYDHFSAEFEYPNGARIGYLGAQIDGLTARNDQRLAGTKGMVYFDFGNATIVGGKAFTYEGEIPDPCIVSHAEHIAAIRKGTHLNEGKQIAESTLTAILGRMSAYTGRQLKWSWAMKASKLDLSPEKLEFGDIAVRPVAIPGKTTLI